MFNLPQGCPAAVLFKQISHHQLVVLCQAGIVPAQLLQTPYPVRGASGATVTHATYTAIKTFFANGYRLGVGVEVGQIVRANVAQPVVPVLWYTV